MATARRPVAAKGVSPARIGARLSTPLAYLGVLGGLQVGLLWVLHAHFGVWLAALATADWACLLAVLGLVSGRWAWKLSLLYLLVGLTAIAPTVIGLVLRPRLGITMEHDGMIQVEAAIDRVLRGQPIYGVDWSGTPLGRMPWSLTGGPNPAIHHLAYFPLTILMGVPVRGLTNLLGLPFDYRLVLVAASLLGLAAIAAIPISAERRFMVTTAVFASPLISLFLWSGRNDIEFLAFVFVSLALLARGHPVMASGALGTAIALKPFALFAAPFLLLVLFLRWRAGAPRHELWMSLMALAVVPLATIAPFFLSDPRAFFADTVLYTSGGVSDAYPIGGYGFGALLLALRVVARPTDTFPFGLWQVPAVVVTLLVAARRFLHRPTLGVFTAGYTLVFLAFVFFARFFNDSYVGVVITLALCAVPLSSASLPRPVMASARQLAA
jgi:hypothetical protein